MAFDLSDVGARFIRLRRHVPSLMGSVLCVSFLSTFMKGSSSLSVNRVVHISKGWCSSLPIAKNECLGRHSVDLQSVPLHKNRLPFSTFANGQTFARCRFHSSLDSTSTSSHDSEINGFSTPGELSTQQEQKFTEQPKDHYYDDEEDEILVANADSLPMGSREGFAVVHHFEIPTMDHIDLEALDLAEKDIKRLDLRPSNMTLPVALMLMDPKKFSTLSRARKFCRHGRILLHRGPLGLDDNGQRTVFRNEFCTMGKVGDRVQPGDVIGRQVAVGSGYFSALQASKRPPFDLPVVYEDDHFAIVNKPAGVMIYSPKYAEQGLMTVKGALPFVLRPPQAGTISALKRPKAVHRLDKPTSGLLLVAKTLPATDNLSRQFRERTVKKTYTAVINGIPIEDVDAAISAKYAHQLGVDVDPTSDEKWQLIDYSLDGKEAVTVWRASRFVNSLKARDGILTLVELKPKTGRYHQLRRHMAWVCERALVGDKEYDGNHKEAVKLRGRGLFLCSNRVTLEHPFYNTRAGREVWNKMDDKDKSFKGVKLWYFEERDSVMVSASVDLPHKFSSFLDRSEEVFQKYAPEEQKH